MWRKVHSAEYNQRKRRTVGDQGDGGPDLNIIVDEEEVAFYDVPTLHTFPEIAECEEEDILIHGGLPFIAKEPLPATEYGSIRRDVRRFLYFDFV